MIRGKTRNAPVGLARALVGAAVAAVGGLAVSLSGAAVPALAAQHPGGPAASHTRPATGRHRATGQMSPGAPWAHIATGGVHTCGIRDDGTLWCWGANEAGELGTGNNVEEDRPRQVTIPAAGGWAAVTAGSSHTCATRTDRTLWCWGFNDYGELGIGNTTGQARPRQVTTPAASGWAAVTAGGYHTCATRTGGTLWCWGDNLWGQLGIGNHTGQNRPQQVTTPATGGWARITAGWEHTCATHTCATRTDGTLWCWGDNDDGELGIGNTTGQVRPRQVITPAAGGWAAVTAGGFHTCATRTGGTLWCWGDNREGQLGLGNTADQDRPRQVTGCAQPGTRARPASPSHSITRRPARPHPAPPAQGDGKDGAQPR